MPQHPVPTHQLSPPRPSHPLRSLVAACTTSAIAAAIALGAWALPSAAAATAPERACTLPGGLAELSGLAKSTKHPGVFYALNDSGNSNQVFAIDCTGATGRLVATLTVGTTTNTDWEAMAVGPDEQGRPSIHVGDIGDNFGGRAEITVHRFTEPDQLTNTTVTPTTYRFAYSDGRHDAESLLINPTTRQIYVASKLFGAAGQLYKAPLPPQSGQLNTLTPLHPGPVFATDGAFSPSGKSYVVRSGGPAGANTAYVYNASGTKLAEVPLPAQPQGETVTYADCATLLVGSENDTQLWRIPLPPEAAPGCGGPTDPPPTGGLKLADPGPQTCKFNQPCTIQLKATGGTPPYTYSVTPLLSGLTLDPTTGRVSGRPWQVGTFQISASATDSKGTPATTRFPLTVNWF